MINSNSSTYKYLKSFYLPVDEIGIKERALELADRSVKNESKLRTIRTVISMLDLTTLEINDSRGKVQALCRKAIKPIEDGSEIPHVAAVCIYPKFIKTAKKVLFGSGVKVASVTASFPSGQIPLRIKLEEVKQAISLGVDEVDIIINRDEFLTGNYDFTFNEVRKIKEVCGNILLKVILETGRLETFDNVRKASLIAMSAGADFIKTSTGKIQPPATIPMALVMLEAIRDFYNEMGRKVGMKPAGGIRTTEAVISYLTLVNKTLGNEWLTPDLFRIGASSLLDDLILQYVKDKNEIYQSHAYISDE
jgi:deoxyribose-phosphate aldolase